MSRQKLKCLGVMGAGLFVASRVLAGSLDPTNAPGPTMHTLEEIYHKVSVNQTLSPTTTVVFAGNYAEANLAQVDGDLLAGNIATNVTLFGIAGTLRTNAYPIAIPKTGQTTSYQAGDDGDYQQGLAWPNPRFTVQADTNCVLDNLTGLVWARNANMLNGAMIWSNAVVYCETLTYGGQTDWRLPNRRELLSLIADNRYGPALCNTAGTGQWTANDPFTSVTNSVYWSSTPYSGSADSSWYVELTRGYPYFGGNGGGGYVWPVRGGQ